MSTASRAPPRVRTLHGMLGGRRAAARDGAHRRQRASGDDRGGRAALRASPTRVARARARRRAPACDVRAVATACGGCSAGRARQGARRPRRRRRVERASAAARGGARQVLVNLAGNAVRVHRRRPRHHRRARAAGARRRGAGHRAPGSRASAPRRSTPRRRRGPGGARGLGLSIAAELVAAMGGAIGARAGDDGAGTTSGRAPQARPPRWRARRTPHPAPARAPPARARSSSTTTRSRAAWPPRSSSGRAAASTPTAGRRVGAGAADRARAAGAPFHRVVDLVLGDGDGCDLADAAARRGAPRRGRRRSPRAPSTAPAAVRGGRRRACVEKPALAELTAPSPLRGADAAPRARPQRSTPALDRGARALARSTRTGPARARRARLRAARAGRRRAPRGPRSPRRRGRRRARAHGAARRERERGARARRAPRDRRRARARADVGAPPSGRALRRGGPPRADALARRARPSRRAAHGGVGATLAP
jgi:hypothetical protein